MDVQRFACGSDGDRAARLLGLFVALCSVCV